MEDFSATQSGTPDNRVVQLAGSMTIHYAAQIKEVLLEAFNGSGQLTCILENVSEIDLAGLQLLCSTHKSCCDAGIPISVKGLLGENVHKTIVEAGFVRHVGCQHDVNKNCLWVGGGE